jgi:nitrate/TMAO reductase-like tetraheme cytochrome c subunit
LAIVVALTVSVGGGTTFLALEITTRPQFCKSCHIMEPYYESWETSGHAHVQCVDCHYEPGLLETFEGKFKALSQLAKYVTATQGTKPWAEVSDYSCMRSGCHSSRLLEGEIRFGRIRFDHRSHLIGMRRGKKLRCTSCHGQIVQGDHLTVTTTSCFLCHFRSGDDTKILSDCDKCHGPPAREIQLGAFVFRHDDYLSRGVACEACHGDVTRGAGEVPRSRCGSCHNRQEHLERYDDVEFMHRNHVTDHSVACLECHTEVRHGLTPRGRHLEGGDCGSCHTGSHGTTAGIYRGTGGRDVPDNPGIMFLARVACNGCHRAPAPDTPSERTVAADPLACIDCHGVGYEGMADRWREEVRRDLGRVTSALAELGEALSEEWERADLAEARRRWAAASHNLGLVVSDGSEGAHNLPYARDLLRRSVEDIGSGWRALDPDESPAPLPIGPRVASTQGCTTLCHVGAESIAVEEALGLRFDHDAHLLSARLDCARCHVAEPHGATRLRPADCASCHHQAEEADACGACHAEVQELRERTLPGGEAAPMADLDCLACHETLANDASVEALRSTCNDCHDEEEDFAAAHYDDWLRSAGAPLDALEQRLAGAPKESADAVRARIAKLRAAGPQHNPAWVGSAAAALAEELDAAGR